MKFWTSGRKSKEDLFWRISANAASFMVPVPSCKRVHFISKRHIFRTSVWMTPSKPVNFLKIIFPVQFEKHVPNPWQRTHWKIFNIQYSVNIWKIPSTPLQKMDSTMDIFLGIFSRSSHQKRSVKKQFLKFCNIDREIPLLELLFYKVAGQDLQTAASGFQKFESCHSSSERLLYFENKSQRITKEMFKGQCQKFWHRNKIHCLNVFIVDFGDLVDTDIVFLARKVYVELVA